ncbi:unnamed protein product, partial [marine sediment metagenome]
MIRKISTDRAKTARRNAKTRTAARRTARTKKKSPGGDGKGLRRAVDPRAAAKKAARAKKRPSGGDGKGVRKTVEPRAAAKKAARAKKRPSGGDGEGARGAAAPRAAAKKAEPTIAAAGLPPTATVSKAHTCRHLPGASQFPAASVSRRLRSPANVTGRVTLARHFGTRGTDWPAEFRAIPFRPGRPKEMGLVSALAWLLSQPVLGGARFVHRIAKGVRDAASRQKRSAAEQLLAMRMKLETGDITQAEFRRLKA